MNWLLLFKEMTAVSSHNHMKYTNIPILRKINNFFLHKQEEQIVTIVPQRVRRAQYQLAKTYNETLANTCLQNSSKCFNIQ
jgi:hypothetical protein